MLAPVRKRVYRRADLNALGYLSTSNVPSVIIDPVTAQVNSLGYQPDRYVYGDEGRFDGDVLMGANFFKQLSKTFKQVQKATTKIVQSKAVKIITAPIRAAVAPVLQTVGLKSMAKQVSGGIYSSGSLKTMGQIGQVAGVVTAGVLLAPVVGGALSSVAGGAGSVASTAGGLAVKGLGSALLPTITQNVVGALTGGGKPQAYSELPADQQQAISQEEYDKMVAEQQAQLAQQAPAIDAQKLYDTGVADATIGKPKGSMANADEYQWYSKGYDDMMAYKRAEQANNATVNPPTVDRPATGLPGPGTNVVSPAGPTPSTYLGPVSYGSGPDLSGQSPDGAPQTAGGIEGIDMELVKKYAPIAIGILTVGFMLSGGPRPAPAVQANPCRYRRNR